MNYYVIKYSGPFGFIKPWTAVRDSETYSQQFLTPSIVEGIEKKLFPEFLIDDCRGKIMKIVRHRLNYLGIDNQQEKTWSKGGFSFNKEKGQYKTNMGILNRGILLEPNLFLAFQDYSYAQRAFEQMICLCRNEDLLLPVDFLEISEADFEEINGFELHFNYNKLGFKVGHNRFDNANEMYGDLKIYGNPIRN